MLLQNATEKNHTIGKTLINAAFSIAEDITIPMIYALDDTNITNDTGKSLTSHIDVNVDKAWLLKNATRRDILHLVCNMLWYAGGTQDIVCRIGTIETIRHGGGFYDIVIQSKPWESCGEGERFIVRVYNPQSAFDGLNLPSWYIPITKWYIRLKVAIMPFYGEWETRELKDCEPNKARRMVWSKKTKQQGFDWRGNKWIVWEDGSIRYVG